MQACGGRKAVLGKSWRQAKRLSSDERGVTVIEFALLAPLFFAIIGAILQTSVIFLASQVLESAVNDAARTIRTGQAQAEGVTIDGFRSEICGRLYGMFGDCSGLHLRIDTVSGFQSATVTPPVPEDCEAPCDWEELQRWTPGVGKEIVLVQAFYRYPVIVQLGALGMANLPDGSRLIGAATVFKNEPF